MKRILLTQDKFALVDDADFKWLNQWSWCASKEGDGLWYAVRGENGTTIRMHRQILGLSRGDGRFGDHHNNDGLDNRRENLRLCSRSQNMHNRRKLLNGSHSQYKGVSFDVTKNKWVARIKLKGKSIFLGRFNDEINAANEYDMAAKKYHREFARLNFTVPAKADTAVAV